MVKHTHTTLHFLHKCKLFFWGLLPASFVHHLFKGSSSSGDTVPDVPDPVDPPQGGGGQEPPEEPQGGNNQGPPAEPDSK